MGLFVILLCFLAISGISSKNPICVIVGCISVIVLLFIGPIAILALLAFAAIYWFCSHA